MTPIHHIKHIMLGGSSQTKPAYNATTGLAVNSSLLQYPVLFPDRVGKKFIILYWTTIFSRNTWNMEVCIYILCCYANNSYISDTNTRCLMTSINIYKNIKFTY